MQYKNWNIIKDNGATFPAINLLIHENSYKMAVLRVDSRTTRKKDLLKIVNDQDPKTFCFQFKINCDAHIFLTCTLLTIKLCKKCIYLNIISH